MTDKELEEIEERWKFGTNTRSDVRALLDGLEEIRGQERTLTFEIVSSDECGYSWLIVWDDGTQTPVTPSPTTQQSSQADSS